MSRYDLHLIVGRDAGPVPALTVRGRHLRDWFRDASGGALALRVLVKRTSMPTRRMTPEGLQRCLTASLSAVRRRPVKRIGLIVARSWHVGAWRDLQGVMFDRAAEDELGRFTRGPDDVPREGCAVFRDATGHEDDESLAFTAIHELGHCFNLGHDLSGRSFMADRGGAPGFLPRDRRHLALAGAGLWQWAPGGAPFRGDAGRCRA